MDKIIEKLSYYSSVAFHKFFTTSISHSLFNNIQIVFSKYYISRDNIIERFRMIGSPSQPLEWNLISYNYT